MKNIQKFRKAFKIDQKADLRDVIVSVDAIYKADQIATNYLGDIEPIDNRAGFRTYALINLLGRIFEHAQAMLVAIATGSASSAEALARTIVEGSVNVIYLAKLGDAATLITFFRVWTGEHGRKLSEWKQNIDGKDESSKISAMIDGRRKVIDIFENYLKQIEKDCAIDMSRAEWPKTIFKRFVAIGRETDYYESYHRLSGSSHITGEDTLMWLISWNMPTEQRQRLGEEAIAYSIMMSRMACTFFVDAVAACVISCGRANNDDLQGCKGSLAKAINDIALDAGVPLRKKE